MERSTADIIRKVYATLILLNAFLLFVISVVLVFSGTLLSALVDENIAALLELPDVFVGKVLGALGVAAGIVLLVFCALYVLAGVGLFRRQNWARIVAIVLCVFGLFSFPIGTIIGGFGIWFFGFSADGKASFQVVAPTPPARRKKK